MLLTTACRLCGATRLRVAMTLENVPRNIQRLPADRDIASDLPATLRVFQCVECQFVQLAEELETGYYDEYLMTTSHSPQMRRYQCEQAIQFVTRFNLAGKRVVEVGCGDGNYLGYLLEAGATPIGLEPSEVGRRHTAARGFEALSGYVGRETIIQGSPYDGFVARQVLEHIADVNGFLQGVANSLKDGAAALIEVPRLEQALERERFYDFFADHLNYFSKTTLAHAMERNGFRIVDIYDGMGAEYHVALAVKVARPDLSALERASRSAAAALQSIVSDHSRRGKRVAAWGAGGKGNTILAVSRATDLAYVIDSDPVKQGRFTPVSHIRIVPPETLLHDPVDTVILTALAYRDEILAQLRDTLHFSGEVAILGEHIQ